MFVTHIWSCVSLTDAEFVQFVKSKNGWKSDLKYLSVVCGIFMC